MTSQEIIKLLESVLQWLNNIEAQHSTNLLLDAMPNNWCGRFDIEDAIATLRKKEQEKE